MWQKRYILKAVIQIFLRKIFSFSDDNATGTDNRCITYFCLPFTSTHSLCVCTQVTITKLLASCFPNINLRMIFKPGRRLSSFFPLWRMLFPNYWDRMLSISLSVSAAEHWFWADFAPSTHARAPELLGISHSKVNQYPIHINTTKHKSVFTTFVFSLLLTPYTIN